MSETIDVPYEYLAEHLAKEAIERLYTLHDIRDPAEIVGVLPDILQAAFHEGIETGLGLADLHFNDLSGPAELMAAYKLGAEEAQRAKGD